MARQARPHSAASAWRMSGSRAPPRGLRLSVCVIPGSPCGPCSYPSPRAEQGIEQPLDQAAAVDDDVGLQQHARAERDFMIVCRDGLAIEAGRGAIGGFLEGYR